MPSKPNILARVPASVRRRVMLAFMRGDDPGVIAAWPWRSHPTKHGATWMTLSVVQVCEIIRRLGKSGRW